MNFYKRHIGDFAKATAQLTQSQVGAYDLLLDWYYGNERPLPSDMEDIFRISRAHSKEEKRSTEKVLNSFFTLTDRGWEQGRADKEVFKYQEVAEKNKTNGVKGGRPISKTESKPNQNPNGSENITESKPNQNLSQKPDTRIEARSNTLAQQAARFDEFWSAYPCRKGKANALKKWKSRNLDAIADKIIADVKDRMARDRQWIEGFVPHGSTYVNGSGWEDAIEPVRAKLAAVGGYMPLPGER